MAVASLRLETVEVVNLADRDLTRLWQIIAAGEAVDQVLYDLLPAVVTEYGAIGAALAAEWYDAQREKVEAKGSFRSTPIKASDRGTAALIGWATATARDDTSLKALIAGGVQRRVADHVRYTVAGSSVEDSASRGWQRTGAGECKDGFCDMLIARGAVYSEAGADFAAHDNCKCSAVPAWDGQPKPVKAFTPSLRNITDADRARLREYLATH